MTLVKFLLPQVLEELVGERESFGLGHLGFLLELALLPVQARLVELAPVNQLVVLNLAVGCGSNLLRDDVRLANFEVLGRIARLHQVLVWTQSVLELRGQRVKADSVRT